MQKFIFLFFCLFVLIACKNHTKDHSEETSEISAIGIGDRLIRQNPDTTFVIEEVDTELLQKTIVNNVRVVDNHLQVSLTRKEFVDLGLPDEYYDRLLKSLDEVNHMVDSTGLENMDQILKESYEDLYKMYGYPEAILSEE